MPECIEIEMYRRPLLTLVGAKLRRVELLDHSYARPIEAGPTLAALSTTTLTAVRRIGKLLLLDHDGPDLVGTLGLRFGMTGRLLVDEVSPIDKLEYSSGRNDPSWDRVRLHYDGPVVAVRDPRRLGAIELEPDETALGPDAWTLTPTELATVLGRRTAPVKATLLNQKAIAGLGNLLADEVLWQAGLAPTRATNSLTERERSVLARTIPAVITELDRRGGSHTGDNFAHRSATSSCPLDGSLLRHDTVGGRSSWWCPVHQV